MNDWIIFGLLSLAIIETIFIVLRIKSSSDDWVFHKGISIVLGFFISMLHLIMLTDNTLVGEPVVFHFERLLYEGYAIAGLLILFILNYLLSEFIDYAKGRNDDE